MRSYVFRTVSGCFTVLRQLRSIRVQCLTLCSNRWSFRWLCHGSTNSRRLYGNATLVGLPTSQLRRLQLLLNAATRITHRSSQYQQVTPMLRDLRWLRSLSALILSWPCLSTDVSTAWRNSICPTTSSVLPTPIVAISGRRHPRS